MRTKFKIDRDIIQLEKLIARCEADKVPELFKSRLEILKSEKRKATIQRNKIQNKG